MKWSHRIENSRLQWHHIRSTAQKMKFSIKDFSSKCDQIRSLLRIWSHLLEESLMENLIFCVVFGVTESNVKGKKEIIH